MDQEHGLQQHYWDFKNKKKMKIFAPLISGSLSVSGSSSISGSLNVTQGITGSLFGTASSALTASYVNTLNQNVTINGSLNSNSDLPLIISSSSTVGALVFDGVNYLTMSPGIVVGSGSFTAESFVYITEYPGDRHVIFAATTSGSAGFSFGVMTSTEIFVDRDGVSANVYAFASSFPLNTWFHIAVTKNSAGQETVFVNGVKSTSSYGSDVDYAGTTNAISKFNEGVWLLRGRISQARLVVGSNVYDPTSSTITVPTAPLTDIIDTKVLLNVISSGSYINDTSGNQILTNNNSVTFNSSGPVSSSLAVEFLFDQNGGLTATSFTGSLLGNASTATISLYSSSSLSSSFAATSLYSLSSLSSSFAATSSYALNTRDSFPYSGSAVITGSLLVTNGITGSLFGTASSAISASYATTATNIEGGGINHIPYFITNTTLATSSIYQSGSTSVIINQDNNTTANPEALYVWQPHPTSINVISGKGNLDNYLQLNIQNTNQGTNASSDIVATADNGNESSNYIDMGINGENFSGDIGGANDAYIYSTGQHLYIGNASAGQYVGLFAGGTDVDTNMKLLLRTDDLHELTGSLNIQDTLIVNEGIVLTGSLLITGSTLQTGSNTLLGNTTLLGNININGNGALTGSFNVTGSTLFNGINTISGTNLISGSLTVSSSHDINNPNNKIQGDVEIEGGLKFLPVIDNINNLISGSYIYASGSTNDLYFTQNFSGLNNTTRLRWLEGNLYTGLLNGGILSTTPGSTTFNLSSGSGIVVSLNASLNDNPYPTTQFVKWNNFTNQSLPYLTSSIQTFLGVGPDGQIIQQTSPWDSAQYNSSISIGTVLHQNQATTNGSISYPNVAYGWKQRSYDFVKAFGPLKLSGYILAASGSSTGSLVVGSGTAWSDGRNYQTDPNSPSYITDPGTNVSKIFRYYQSGSGFVQDTNGGAGYIGIDPGYYNPNGDGILTAVTSSTPWTNQRVFWYPNSTTKGIIVYYGTAQYATETEAINNLPYEQFLETPNTQQNAIYLGDIVIKYNGSLQDPSTARILPGGLFRSVGGSGGGGSTVTTTLAGLSDVAISGQTDGQPLVYSNIAGKWINASYISGSVYGNAQTATSSSFATTSSYALNAEASFPYTGSAIITGSLDVIGSITSTQGFTGSLFGTSSFAVTASYYDGSIISASYAVSSSNSILAVNAQSGSNFVVTSTLQIDRSLIDYSTITSTIVGTNNLYTQTTGSYTAAFCKYTVFNGTNARAGEFMTVWNGSTTTFTDTSTTDLGNTSDITFTAAVVTGNIQISTVAASSGWTIKSLVTYI
jgi:hypothetical protein